MAKAVRSSAGRIIVDPDILVGKPVVKGTRISVEMVLQRLARDLDVSALLEDYPRLSVEDVKACIEYAGGIVEGERIILGPNRRPRNAAAS